MGTECKCAFSKNPHRLGADRRANLAFVLKALLILITVLLAGPVQLFARLGDPGETIDDSYGNVVGHHLQDDGTVALLYRGDRYMIHVVIDHGRSVSERYWRVDGHALGQKEIDRLLKANGGKWNANGPGTFLRSDGEAEATIAKEGEKIMSLTVRRVGRK
jgi:hypothetical protein